MACGSSTGKLLRFDCKISGQRKISEKQKIFFRKMRAYTTFGAQKATWIYHHRPILNTE